MARCPADLKAIDVPAAATASMVGAAAACVHAHEPAARCPFGQMDECRASGRVASRLARLLHHRNARPARAPYNAALKRGCPDGLRNTLRT
jgi:hypothetical protein